MSCSRRRDARAAIASSAHTTTSLATHLRRDDCFAEALSESFDQFPELFGLGGADFIRCRRCGNATLRLREGEQEVRTEEQALELIARLGYGCLVKYEVPGYP